MAGLRPASIQLHPRRPIKSYEIPNSDRCIFELRRRVDGAASAGTAAVF